MESKVNTLKINTLLTAFGTVLLMLLSFLGLELWTTTAKNTKVAGEIHESVSVIQATMVRQTELAEVRTEIAALQQKYTEMTQKAIELQHAQDALALEIRRIRQSSVATKPGAAHDN